MKQKLFNKLLKKHFQPEMKKMGFTGSGNEYKKENENAICFLRVQLFDDDQTFMGSFSVLPKLYMNEVYKKYKILKKDWRIQTTSTISQGVYIAPPSQISRRWIIEENEEGAIEIIKDVLEHICMYCLPTINHFFADQELKNTIEAKEIYQIKEKLKAYKDLLPNYHLINSVEDLY